MTFAGEFLGLPGLRGYWGMGAFDNSGNAIDQSGNGRTLTYTGNPTYNFHASGGPYLAIDGTGDYLTRASEAGLDITGSEGYVASAAAGLTIGGWFYASSTSGSPSLIGKHDNATAANSAYLLYLVSGAPNFIVYNSTNLFDAVSSTTLSTSTWYFIAGRYDPSTEVAIFVNGVKNTDTTSIPASLNASTSAFQIGARAAGSLLTGRLGMCFVCAMTLSDTSIDNIYLNTRSYYGL